MFDYERLQGHTNDRVAHSFDPGDTPEDELDTVAMFLETVRQEYERARSKQGAGFEPFHSLHEGYAVLLEEVTELQQQVFRKNSQRYPVAIFEECMQIAAMALAIVQECLPDDFITYVIDENGRFTTAL